MSACGDGKVSSQGSSLVSSSRELVSDVAHLLHFHHTSHHEWGRLPVLPMCKLHSLLISNMG